jgi:hypothetical protein
MSLIFVKCDVISYYTNYTNYTNIHMDTNLTFVEDDMECGGGVPQTGGVLQMVMVPERCRRWQCVTEGDVQHGGAGDEDG